MADTCLQVVTCILPKGCKMYATLRHRYCPGHVVHPENSSCREIPGQTHTPIMFWKTAGVCNATQEERTFGRIQKRAVHLLAQKAEAHLGYVLSSSMPQPSRDDCFHPATKCLGCKDQHASFFLHVTGQGWTEVTMRHQAQEPAGNLQISLPGRGLLRGRA